MKVVDKGKATPVDTAKKEERKAQSELCVWWSALCMTEEPGDKKKMTDFPSLAQWNVNWKVQKIICIERQDFGAVNMPVRLM